jgi:hypothetical protein
MRAISITLCVPSRGGLLLLFLLLLLPQQLLLALLEGQLRRVCLLHKVV